jgi:hypothetical protein
MNNYLSKIIYSLCKLGYFIIAKKIRITQMRPSLQKMKIFTPF